MNLLRTLAGRREERADPLSMEQWMGMFGLGGPTPFLTQSSLGGKTEEIGADFTGMVRGAYKANGIVFACMVARMTLFAEARFQFQRLQSGRPGDLFGTRDLALLETPWPNGTTADLLSRMIQDADLSGSWYGARRPAMIQRLQPDWVTIIMGSRNPDPDAGMLDTEVLGYSYKPGGPMSNAKAIPLLSEEVAHFSPLPDPAAHYRGMSWLTPVIREVMGDQAATEHKLKFFEQGATPCLVVSLDAQIEREAFERWVEMFSAKTEGIENAYKNLYLGAGARAERVGADLKQVDFKVVQGAGETRIAAAAQVPPIIAGLSEGLAASTYSNFGSARRLFADRTLRPLWRQAAGALSSITAVPTDARLWYDDRDISFLQEDVRDDAGIQSLQSVSIRQLIDAGFEPDSVVAAINAGDLKRLRHTGLFSVQLQPPGTQLPASVRQSVIEGQESRSTLLAGLLGVRAGE